MWHLMLKKSNIIPTIIVWWTDTAIFLAFYLHYATEGIMYVLTFHLLTDWAETAYGWHFLFHFNLMAIFLAQLYKNAKFLKYFNLAV